MCEGREDAKMSKVPKKKSVIGLAREVQSHTAIMIAVFLRVMEDVEQHEARVKSMPFIEWKNGGAKNAERKKDDAVEQKTTNKRGAPDEINVVRSLAGAKQRKSSMQGSE